MALSRMPRCVHSGRMLDASIHVQRMPVLLLEESLLSARLLRHNGATLILTTSIGLTGGSCFLCRAQLRAVHPRLDVLLAVPGLPWQHVQFLEPTLVAQRGLARPDC